MTLIKNAYKKKSVFFIIQLNWHLIIAPIFKMETQTKMEEGTASKKKSTELIPTIFTQPFEFHDYTGFLTQHTSATE